MKFALWLVGTFRNFMDMTNKFKIFIKKNAKVFYGFSSGNFDIVKFEIITGRLARIGVNLK